MVCVNKEQCHCTQPLNHKLLNSRTAGLNKGNGYNQAAFAFQYLAISYLKPACFPISARSAQHIKLSQLDSSVLCQFSHTSTCNGF